jgi:hypothetical protein
MLWSGWAVIAASLFMALWGVASGNVSLVLLSLLAGIAGVYLLASHYGREGEILAWCKANTTLIWLVASVVLTVAAILDEWGGWNIALGVLSTLAAVITLGGWWGKVNEGAEEAGGVLWGKFMTFLQGPNGLWVLLAVLAGTTLVIFSYLFLGGDYHFGEDEDNGRATVLAYVLLLLGAVGTIIYKLWNRKPPG